MVIKKNKNQRQNKLNCVAGRQMLTVCDEKKKILSECTKAQMGYKLACLSHCSSVSLIHQTLNNQLLSCGGSC